mgnify:CR=1 FL=1
MKKIFNFVLTCALVVFVPALAMAQMEELKNSTPEERAKEELKKHTDKYEDKLKDKLKGLF